MAGLVAFARLYSLGRPRAGGAIGRATQGLRRRVGLRTWPMLRHGEAELVDQIGRA